MTIRRINPHNQQQKTLTTKTSKTNSSSISILPSRNQPAGEKPKPKLRSFHQPSSRVSPSPSSSLPPVVFIATVLAVG
ncbi:hypothetical protein AAC387_Pa03g4212 [Persea americana]